MSTSRRTGSTTITTLSDLKGTPREGVVLGGHRGAKTPDVQSWQEGKDKSQNEKSKAKDDKGVEIHGNVQKSVVAKDFHAKKKVGFGSRLMEM
ncbi:hypothetical protein PG984_015568 [Apiospora sp. TS-2023a]